MALKTTHLIYETDENSVPAAGLVFTSDGLGGGTWSSVGVDPNLGRILYVSSDGNDSTAEVGNITKPFLTIISAKNTSVSGDTIYVMPQTMTYSNTSALSYPYNGSVNTLVNLWKDDVTYYFSPGTKIIFYNETPSGSDMYLFRPTGGAAATCKVFGELEFEQNGIGSDTSGGVNSYFYGTPIGTDEGYTFYSKTKLIKSNHCQSVSITRTSSTGTASVTIISEEEVMNYVSGQSSSGAFYYINNNAISPLEFTANVKVRRYSYAYPWYFSANSNAADKINILGNDIYNTGGNLFLLVNSSTTINCHLDKVYYTTAWTTFGYSGSVVSTAGTGGWKINLKSDLIDLSPNTLTTGLFQLTTSGNTLNFDGNIITNTISGDGRFIALTTSTENTININGDIGFLGTSSNALFQSSGRSTINYKGKISGKYIGPVVKTYNGIVNINNSVITSTLNGSASQIFINGATTEGTCRINNSYIELSNSTGAISDGSYVISLINNSTIVNREPDSIGLSNTTDFGTLQLSNSVVIVNDTGVFGATAISYTGTSPIEPVIAVNSTVNATYSITDLRGSLPILIDLIY
jgi:hypothetical protein